MPNRILKESICTSDTVNKLSWFEECAFYRLIVNADDFGRMDGRTAVVKSRLFPLKNAVTVRTVEDALNTLASCGLICRYEVKGKPYICLPTWSCHQQIRNKRSKYPAPEEKALDGDLISIDINCNQVDSNCTRNPIQSESESKSGSNPNTGASPCVSEGEEKPVRHKMGEYQNVLLSDEELETVKGEFPGFYDKLIEDLSSYMESTGKRYKSHLATLRNWGRKRAIPAPQQSGTRSLDSVELAAIQRIMEGESK